MADNNWYVITGGPSVGKTTTIAELARRGYLTIPEAARTIIDEAAARGISADELRSDEDKFQRDIALLKQKIEEQADPAVPTFFDRGMHDTLAYMRHYNFTADDWIMELLQKSFYKKVFVLAPLDRFERDYARTEPDDFGRQIHQPLVDAYAEYGMQPIIVKAAPLEERIDFILQEINKI